MSQDELAEPYLHGWTGDKLEHLPILERAKVTLRSAARMKQGWSAAMPRDEARALLNELARLERPA